MTKTRTKKNKNNALPLFIEKLIEMLDDQSIDHIISWTTSKDSFNIKSVSQFTQTILPRFFKHNNFSSFIRQLNMYGFKKTRHDDGQNVYENQHFIKGQKQLLKNIKRKINQDKQDKLALYSQNDGLYGGYGNYANIYNPNSKANFTLNRQVQQMKNKQKDLQQVCRHLLMQNQKLIQENSNLMRKMKDESRKKEKKIQQLLIQFITTQQGQKQIQNTDSLDLGQGNLEKNTKNSTQMNNFSMLSLMNQQNSAQLDFVNNDESQTPLQFLSNAIARNKNMKQMKQMFDSLYSGSSVAKPFNQQNNIKLRGRKDKNFTIVQKNSNKQLAQNYKKKQSLKNYDISNSQIGENSQLGEVQGQQCGYENYNDYEGLNDQMVRNEDDPNNNFKGNLENNNQQNSFLSINDFLNIDQNNNIELENYDNSGQENLYNDQIQK